MSNLRKKLKQITGVFAQQQLGSIDPRTGKWKPKVDQNENILYSTAFTFTMENTSKAEVPAVLTAKRIAGLKVIEPKAFRLDESKDYVLTRTQQFEERDGRPPAVKAWYRPKAEPVTI